MSSWIFRFHFVTLVGIGIEKLHYEVQSRSPLLISGVEGPSQEKLPLRPADHGFRREKFENAETSLGPNHSA